MVLVEVTKLILTRGDNWALVQYRTKEQRGSCGGVFGCAVASIVPGQIYRGTFTEKRTRSGDKKLSFKGTPVSRVAHALKTALKQQGISYPDRSAIFSNLKPLNTLLYTLKHKRSQDLMAIPKIGRKKLARIFSAYDAVHSELDQTKDFGQALPTLAKYMSRKQLEAALRWKNNSMEEWIKFVRTDPWRIIYDIEYDSFPYTCSKRSDFLSDTKLQSRSKMAAAAAADLGLLLSDPRAKRCKAIHTIRQYMKQTGNYWMPLHQFMREFDHMAATWPIVVHDGHVALLRFADIEKFLQQTFESIQQANHTISFTALPDDVQLDEHQRRAVQQACENPVFILQGGAGVGKTTVCKHIVSCLNRDVTCAAPTGKAAQRLAQLTSTPAYTVHRLFYAETTPVASTLLLDEQSMQEPEILARLLAKRTFKKIIFVGDTAQLTSVGPGQFFKDLCASDIPRVELTKIYRSGDQSFIASNGQKIRNGDTQLDTSPESFVIQRYRSDDDIVTKAQAIYDREQRMPMVLCNTNAEISSLNYRLRQICNPIGSTPCSAPTCMDYVNKKWRYDQWCFGIGDSVINIENKYESASLPNGTASTQLVVANGEIGTVKRVSGNKVWVQFDRLAEFDLSEDKNLRPAYALTVNKAQGSEYPVVIVKSSSCWGDKRERFYTAVTRAKEKCIVFEVGTANTDCIRAKPANRKTYFMKHTLEN